jgi:hypothetical protein
VSRARRSTPHQETSRDWRESRIRKLLATGGSGRRQKDSTTVGPISLLATGEKHVKDSLGVEGDLAARLWSQSSVVLLLRRAIAAYEDPPLGCAVLRLLDFLRSNREWKCMVKWEALEEHETTWKSNGMADLKYSVLETKSLDDSKKSTKVTVDVKLNGTHWANAKSGMDFTG